MNLCNASSITMSLRKKKQRKVISVLKEDHQVIELFVRKYSGKHEAFKYPLTTFPLTVSIPEVKL